MLKLLFFTLHPTLQFSETFGEHEQHSQIWGAISTPQMLLKNIKNSTILSLFFSLSKRNFGRGE